ncbi:MAG: hypothetical protein C0409_09575 [Novosphingobium sp.]|nr:hypothetical protein [Novosphingobium sp.]
MYKSSIGAAFLCATFVPQTAVHAADDMSRRPSAPKPAAPVKDADLCGMQNVSRYVGVNAAAPVRSAVATAVGHDRIRWIKPGSAVTQDYRPDRLNVILDDAGRVMTMRCG